MASRLLGAAGAYWIARQFGVRPIRAAWLAVRFAATGSTGLYSVRL